MKKNFFLALALMCLFTVLPNMNLFADTTATTTVNVTVTAVLNVAVSNTATTIPALDTLVASGTAWADAAAAIKNDSAATYMTCQNTKTAKIQVETQGQTGDWNYTYLRVSAAQATNAWGSAASNIEIMKGTDAVESAADFITAIAPGDHASTANDRRALTYEAYATWGVTETAKTVDVVYTISAP